VLWLLGVRNVWLLVLSIGIFDMVLVPIGASLNHLFVSVTLQALVYAWIFPATTMAIAGWVDGHLLGKALGIVAVATKTTPSIMSTLYNRMVGAAVDGWRTCYYASAGVAGGMLVLQLVLLRSSAAQLGFREPTPPGKPPPAKAKVAGDGSESSGGSATASALRSTSMSKSRLSVRHASNTSHTLHGTLLLFARGARARSASSVRTGAVPCGLVAGLDLYQAGDSPLAGLSRHQVGACLIGWPLSLMDLAMCASDAPAQHPFAHETTWNVLCILAKSRRTWSLLVGFTLLCLCKNGSHFASVYARNKLHVASSQSSDLNTTYNIAAACAGLIGGVLYDLVPGGKAGIGVFMACLNLLNLGGFAIALVLELTDSVSLGGLHLFMAVIGFASVLPVSLPFQVCAAAKWIGFASRGMAGHSAEMNAMARACVRSCRCTRWQWAASSTAPWSLPPLSS
jgi:sugar phosphate permease